MLKFLAACLRLVLVRGGKMLLYPVQIAVTEHPCHHYILSLRVCTFFFVSACIFR